MPSNKTTSLVYHLPLKRGKTVIFDAGDFMKSQIILDEMEKKRREQEKKEEEEKRKMILERREDGGSSAPATMSNLMLDSDSDDEEFVPLHEDSDQDEDAFLSSELDRDVNTSSKLRQSNQLTADQQAALFSNRLDTPDIEELFRQRTTPEGILLHAARGHHHASASSSADEMLNSRNAHISRLGMVIRNIEMREQNIKSTLVRGDNAGSGNFEDAAAAAADGMSLDGGGGADFHGGARRHHGRAHHDDEDDMNDYDSFIDDTGYDDFVEPSSSTGGAPGASRHAAPRHVSWDFAGRDYRHDERDGESDDEMDDEEDGTHHRHGAHSSSGERAPSSTSGKDTFEPDLENALRKLQQRLTKLKKEKYPAENDPKFLPEDDIKDEFAKVSALRAKYFTRGVPTALTRRLMRMPILNNFTQHTVKNSMKNVLSYHEAKEIINNTIPDLKKKLKEFAKADMVSALSKKMAASKKGSGTDESSIKAELAQKSHQELMDMCNAPDMAVKVRWKDKTSRAFHKLMQEFHHYIEGMNKMKKGHRGRGAKAKSNHLDEEEEEKKLLKDLKTYWPKPPQLKKKYEKLKLRYAEEEKNEDSDSSTPKKEGGTTDSEKKESASKKKSPEGKKKMKKKKSLDSETAGARSTTTTEKSATSKSPKSSSSDAQQKDKKKKKKKSEDGDAVKKSKKKKASQGESSLSGGRVSLTPKAVEVEKSSTPQASGKLSTSKASGKASTPKASGKASTPKASAKLSTSKASTPSSTQTKIKKRKRPSSQSTDAANPRKKSKTHAQSTLSFIKSPTTPKHGTALTSSSTPKPSPTPASLKLPSKSTPSPGGGTPVRNLSAESKSQESNKSS